MPSKTFIPLFLTLFALQACSPGNNPEPASLKKAFKDYFYVGAAISARQIGGSDTASKTLLSREFSSITAENVMKWQLIHPAPDSFSFELPDRMIRLGEENEMFIVGHNLVWHNQLADYVWEGNPDSATLIRRIREHIQAVAGRYKGRVHGWDVVNEAISEDGSFRESPFYTIAGKAYIHKAFEFAQAADPGAELYYNDYNLWKPAKRDGVIRLVKEMQDKGIRIDGIGMQGHWGLNQPSLEMIEESMLKFAELGVDLHISELDISVLPDPEDYQGADVTTRFEDLPGINPYTNRLPDSLQHRLAQRYAATFKLFLKHQDKIKRVTFWGLHDEQSWLNNFPVRGRTNYPLLFDRNSTPKPAYFEVLKTSPACN